MANPTLYLGIRGKAVTTTSGAVTASIATITIPAGSAYLLTANFVCREKTGGANNRGGFVRRVLVANLAGVVAVVGTVDSPFSRDTVAGATPDATIDVSGAVSPVRLRVTGAALIDFNWSVDWEITEVNDNA